MPAKLYHVDLTAEERQELEEVIKNRDSKSSIVKRAFILLAADRNGDLQWKDEQISKSYKSSQLMVHRLRKRFVMEGFDIALRCKKREVFREKIFTGDVEAKLIAMRCSETPKGYNKWTYRLLADKMVEMEYVESISHESVRQILKKTK